MDAGLDPLYVMDEMQMYEIDALVSSIYRKKKDNWEQARLIAYLIAQTNSTKKLSIQDIMKFQWEDDDTDIKKTTRISDDDIKRLRDKANKITNTK